MKGITTFVASSLALLGQVSATEPASPVEERAAAPTVQSGAGTIVGVSGINIETFHGIPFGKAPVGNLRLKPPVRITEPLERWDGSEIAAACPQFIADTSSNDLIAKVLSTVADTQLFQKALKVSEDCLSITVSRPIGTKKGDKLPVLFWIFGGGFELGWSWMYHGAPLLTSSLALGKPFVFVAVNYRVGGFGFLPGKEVLRDGASNLGLLDQRMGLEWVSDYIDDFGGDPDKVTIWGESAGAISVFDQMALYDGNNTYKGKPLFRAGIMNSGSVIPADPVDCPKGQAVYDQVVRTAGCSGAADTLDCLRKLPYDQFLNAANSVPAILSYNSVALSYLPRPDGKVLTQSPDLLVRQRKYAAVPMIVGDMEDEGTLFSLFQSNVTTTSRLENYLSSLFLHNASKQQVAGLVDQYSPLASAGAPHRTGILNQVYPGFKRIASLLGDLVFMAPRRLFLEIAQEVNPDVPAWSYLGSYNYGTPILGTFHGSDILQVFYGILPNYASKAFHSFYFNFLYNLDPNDYSGGTNSNSKVFLNWPMYYKNKILFQFFNNRGGYTVDDHRKGASDYIKEHVDSFHI